MSSQNSPESKNQYCINKTSSKRKRTSLQPTESPEKKQNVRNSSLSILHSSKGLICEICHLTFNNNRYLDLHMHNKHPIATNKERLERKKKQIS